MHKALFVRSLTMITILAFCCILAGCPEDPMRNALSDLQGKWRSDDGQIFFVYMTIRDDEICTAVYGAQLGYDPETQVLQVDLDQHITELIEVTGTIINAVDDADGIGTYDTYLESPIDGSPVYGYNIYQLVADGLFVGNNSEGPRPVDFSGAENVTKYVPASSDEPFELTFDIVGQGTITDDPNDGDASLTTGDLFIGNAAPHLTAKPAGSWRFSHWEGDLSGTQPSAQLLMDSDKHVIAVFVGLDEGEGYVPMEGEYPTETLLLPGNVPLELVRIPAGSFQMGSPDTERSRSDDEGPIHTVTINYDFYMGKYEVTQAQWLAVMGSSPGGYAWDYGQGDTYPAYYVSWDDAQAFITALNTHITNTGQGPATVRLPSEAEWEYACRAGTQTRFYFGDSLSVGDECEDDGVRSQYMWYCGNNSPYGSKPVGGKLPNAFGLHDMSGNLWEWCEDDWHYGYSGAPSNGSAWIDSPRGSGRVARGGLWRYLAQYCRSADRSFGWPDDRGGDIGFRLVR